MNAPTILPTNSASKLAISSNPVQIAQWKKRALTAGT